PGRGRGGGRRPQGPDHQGPVRLQCPIGPPALRTGIRQGDDRSRHRRRPRGHDRGAQGVGVDRRHRPGRAGAGHGFDPARDVDGSSYDERGHHRRRRVEVYLTIAMTWPDDTVSPGSTRRSTTSPVAGLFTSLSIFIASRTQIGSPSVTAGPALTWTFTI